MWRSTTPIDCDDVSCARWRCCHGGLNSTPKQLNSLSLYDTFEPSIQRHAATKPQKKQPLIIKAKLRRVKMAYGITESYIKSRALDSWQPRNGISVCEKSFNLSHRFEYTKWAVVKFKKVAKLTFFFEFIRNSFFFTSTWKWMLSNV